MTDERPWRPRLLILDDEEAVAFPMAQFFARCCDVDTAHEAEEAQALVAFRRYDLAILDLRLGGGSGAEGLDVLRELRRRAPFTSVIVLSAHVSDELEEQALRAGADRVLVKPQPLAELSRHAKRLVGLEHA